MDSWFPGSCLMAALVLLSGCPGSGGASGSGGSGDRATEIDKAAAESLAEAGKTCEAREWCRKEASMGFEVGTDVMLELAEEAYAAGATDVQVVGIETLGEREISAAMVLTLPGIQADRARLFEWYGKLCRERLDETPPQDVGQRYFYLALD